MKQWIFCSFAFVSTVFSEEAAYREVEDTSRLPLLSPTMQERRHAKIELKNGLFAYLISDPHADQSAAALCVNSGSWNDPEKYPGMAHLLEHMLFLGTDKYPDESGFSKFLSNHNGKSNAYTAPDRTVYFFSINSDSFLEGLDQFSHFFIDPLLSSSSIGRELHNVDQEYAKNIENDGWRAHMIGKETGNQNHPNRGFSTGNSQTLSSIPPQTIRKWYERNYSSHAMRLVVYSPLSLEELKENVTLLFCQIPKRSKEFLSLDEPVSSPLQKGHITYIKPVKNLQRLSLLWELPKRFADDESKSAHLIAYALMRGQKYSLLENLKIEGLINHLSVRPESIGKHHIFIEIDCDLTDEGLQKKDLVVERIFQALKGLQQSGIPPYLFEEMNTMAKLDYQYQSRQDAFDFVSAHANLLMDEPLSSYPERSLVADHYSAQTVAAILNYMTPSSAQYTLIASPEKTGIPVDKEEKWMGAQYSVREMDSHFLAQLDEIKANPSIKLAHPNPYLPTNLSLIEGSEMKEPFKLIDDEMGTVYFLKDDEFLTPEVSHLIHIKSPSLDKSARSQVLLEIYVKHLTKTIHPTLSCAKAAGLNAEFSLARNSLNLMISGYSEKAPLLIEEILKMMDDVPTKKEFTILFDSLLKKYTNASKDLPVYQAIELTSSLLQDDAKTKQEKLKELISITYEDLLKFHESVFANAYIEAFLSGNLTVKDAESIWLDICHLLGSYPYPIDQHIQNKVFTFPETTGPYFIQKDTEVSGNGVVLVLDMGSFSFEKRAAQTILSKALHEAFFDTLRTKQKTAYIAASFDREQERRLFQYFAVQSNSHDPLDLTYRFELFLESFLQEIEENISRSRFDMIRQSQITKLEMPHRSLDEKTQFLDLIAFQYDEDFSWKAKRIEGLQSLTYERFLEQTKEFLSRKNRKRLAILYTGKNFGEQFSYENISTESLKEMGRYEEPKKLATN